MRLVFREDSSDAQNYLHCLTHRVKRDYYRKLMSTSQNSPAHRNFLLDCFLNNHQSLTQIWSINEIESVIVDII